MMTLPHCRASSSGAEQASQQGVAREAGRWRGGTVPEDGPHAAPHRQPRRRAARYPRLDPQLRPHTVPGQPAVSRGAKREERSPPPRLLPWRSTPTSPSPAALATSLDSDCGLYYRCFVFSRVTLAAACRRPPSLSSLPFCPADWLARRQRREKGRGGEGERMMAWHPDMWGPCGSHAESAATSDKTGVKTTEGPSLH
uniref:Uncharacterized protein n=1 Tax=Oryza barthii TaxID=65489 RepID=A0A0D3HE75_9ORYZ